MEASRPARADDVARLAELVEAAEAELAELKGGEVWRALRQRPGSAEDHVRAALADPDALVLAGTIDGAVVGYALAIIEALRDGRRLARMEDIFVEEGARGVGLGEALIVDVLAWAKDRDCFGVDATALPGHRATKNFFEESGLTARLLIMHRTL